jgi:SAM-dependent methyltransferase
MRLDLHDFGKAVETRPIRNQTLDIADESVDYIHTSGVLHHVPDLPATLEELHRVLRHNGRIRVMVYNEESLWQNLYVPYVLQLKRREIPIELSIREAFRISTDGLTCPVSEAYTVDSFQEIASRSGFRTVRVGSSISLTELEAWKNYARGALRHPGLAVEHREFLGQVRCAKDGTLSRNGEIPGINLVLELTKVPARDGLSQPAKG